MDGLNSRLHSFFAGVFAKCKGPEEAESGRSERQNDRQAVVARRVLSPVVKCLEVERRRAARGRRSTHQICIARAQCGETTPTHRAPLQITGGLVRPRCDTRCRVGRCPQGGRRANMESPRGVGANRQRWTGRRVESGVEVSGGWRGQRSRAGAHLQAHDATGGHAHTTCLSAAGGASVSRALRARVYPRARQRNHQSTKPQTLHRCRSTLKVPEDIVPFEDDPTHVPVIVSATSCPT